MNENPQKLKVLHTSDWHLGKSLYDKKRYSEFNQFLDWLLVFLEEKQIDILLVAGDIFDTTTPSNKAQELYYKFLSGVKATGCRHVVITGGNHDSPTFLNAPQNLLKALNVHVVGATPAHIEDEVVSLKNADGETEMIICAVPFLRDKDIRIVEEGESSVDKSQKLIRGIENHYAEVEEVALRQQNGNESIPIVGMGHLFTSGGQVSEGDGVRDLYVGTLAHVTAGIFGKGFDYVALGHLHISQIVGGSNIVRYSGSPIQMGFGEAGQSKKVIMVEFEDKKTDITEHNIPCFQKLEQLSGDINSIEEKIVSLKEEKENAWLEIELTNNELASNISEKLDQLVTESGLEILRIKNKFISERTLASQTSEESLEELDEQQVFDRCLETYEIPESDRKVLKETYNETIQLLNQTDSNAE